MDYFLSILARKNTDLKKILPLEGKLRASAILRNDYAGFRTAVDMGETSLSVIPEIAKNWPLSPTLTSSFDLKKQYQMYLQGGASGISISVDPEVFHGSWDMVSTISRISAIPVLARDIFIHPVQVCQAIVSGADAINLMPAALTASELEPLYRMATGLGLDVMLEVHTLQELEAALDLDAEFICLNNTDLHTMQSDLSVTEKLIEEIPASVTVLACGGINSASDAQRMLEAGVNGVILQDSLAAQNIPQDFMADILSLRLTEE